MFVESEGGSMAAAAVPQNRNTSTNNNNKTSNGSNSNSNGGNLVAATTTVEESNSSALDAQARDYVRLISSDGFEFGIDRRSAMASGTIKALLSSPNRFIESQQNVIEFKNIKCAVFEIASLNS
jgi:Skp1 family, tetramerisation domain